MLTLSVLMIGSLSTWAAATATAPTAASVNFMNTDSLLRWILVGVIVLFVLIIAVLANAIKVAGGGFE